MYGEGRPKNAEKKFISQLRTGPPNGTPLPRKHPRGREEPGWSPGGGSKPLLRYVGICWRGPAGGEQRPRCGGAWVPTPTPKARLFTPVPRVGTGVPAQNSVWFRGPGPAPDGCSSHWPPLTSHPRLRRLGAISWHERGPVPALRNQACVEYQRLGAVQGESHS
jgi:hypothetical protein